MNTDSLLIHWKYNYIILPEL